LQNRGPMLLSTDYSAKTSGVNPYLFW